jgi:hypothetical protein
MADYVPVFVPSRAGSMTASVAITGGSPLVVSGSGTVAPAAANASAQCIGVAGNDTVPNGRVTVYMRGFVHESVADGPVTAGDQVGTTATANRQVKTIAPAAVDMGAAFTQATSNAAVNAGISAARAVLGIALTTAADGVKVRWLEY